MARLKSLKQQRNELRSLLMKQRKAKRKEMAAKREEAKLKLEIKKLKAETSQSTIRKISRTIKAADTPERRKKAKQTVSKLKKGFAAFEDFATKASKKLDKL